MLLFCPHCSNILRIQTYTPPLSSSGGGGGDGQPGGNRFICQTCTYVCPLSATARFFEAHANTRKEVEDVIGGPGAWDDAQKTDVRCKDDACDGAEAMFYQLQIRSADEPMTSFYKCATCLAEWREG